MSEVLHDLFCKSLSGQIAQNERDQVTESLILFYSNPQSTLDLLTFILNEQNPIIRQAGVIGLKKSLALNWKRTLCDSQFHDQIKQSIILIFQNETIPQIRHTAAQSVRPIYKTDAGCWPELFELVSNLTTDKARLDAVEFSLYLISYFVSYLAPSVISQNLQWFVSLIEFSFETNNQDLIDTACGLIAVLIRDIEDDERAMFQSPFMKMLEVYANSLTEGGEYARKISEKLSFAFIGNSYPFPNDLILSKLYEVVPRNPVMAFGPIHQFIESCGKSLTPLLPIIIQQTLQIAALLFIDAPLEDNSDAMYVLYAIELAGTTMKQRVFFEKLVEMLQTTTVNESIVSAMAVSRVLYISSESVTKHMSFLAKFILKILEIPHVCAKEVAVESIKDIANLFEEGNSTIANTFMSPLIELLSCNEPELIRRTLLALRKLFRCCDIDVSLINPSLQSLIRLLQLSNNNQIQTAVVVDTLSALVFSAGEDIAPFVGTLFPLIIQTASLPEEADPNLKANSIEALSNLLRFSKDLANAGEDTVNKAISLIVMAGQTNDFDIRGSVMTSISNLLAVDIPQLSNFVQPINKLISVYINEEIQQSDNNSNNNENNDDMEDFSDDEVEKMLASNQNQINSLTNTLLLIKNIYKLKPENAPQDPTEWLLFSVNCMEAINDDLTVSATLAALYILFKVNADPLPFLGKLKDNFENESAVIVACCFKVISRFMENDVQIPEEIIIFTIEQGKKALTNNLPCQDEELILSDSSYLTLSMQVNRFFATLATKMPQNFPINNYIDHKKHINGEFEMSQYIGVLRQYYINYGQNMKAISKKIMFMIFIENILICNFTVIPEPLIALRNVIEREHDKIGQHIQNIVAFVQTLFEQENEGQVHYWTTMTNAVSFLFSMMKIDPQNFEYAKWMPHILAVLPVKGDEMEAEHIFGSLIWLLNQNNSVSEMLTQQFSQELIRIFAQTLGLKEKIFNSYNLSQQTSLSIAQILINLMQIPGANDIFVAALPDQMSQQRCQQRLSSISQVQQQ